MDDTRKRSFWGWGWEDRFPDAASRRRSGSTPSRWWALRRSAATSRRRSGRFELRASRLSAPASLAGIVSNDHEARVRHTYGRSYRDVLRGFRGDFSAAPDLVATPGTEGEISALLDWAADAKVAIIPFGGGTSVVGGVEGEVDDRYRGVLSLDLGRLDRVLEVEPSSMSARIQAGATGPVLESQLEAHGLTLRHFPQSFEFSTLGGWLATRAGGHFATVYTRIDDLVQSTRAVTPRGLWESRRLPGSAPDRARTDSCSAPKGSSA